MRRPPLSLATLAVLVALTAASETVIQQHHAAFAQSPAPVTAAPEVPEGTVVRIQGTESMKGISEALKQKFEARFSGTKVKFSEKRFDDALKAVQEDKIDLAAIGRNLTAEEKAAGLNQTPVTRHKIAIVVGKDNKFPGDLTDVQFAQIFRGEITNWSQLGGENKPIRMIDRVNSDTRRALETYPVFQSAPFQPGSTAESLDKENVEAMLRRLNEDGISYALLDQVVGQSDVRIVTLYGTPPTDASYPFSQPLTYVYKTPANPTVQAFLGYATAPDVQPALAGVAGTAAAPNSAPEANQDANSESDVAQAPDADGTRTGVPKWLWLLSVPLLAILIWFLLKGLDRSDEGTVTAVGGAVAGSEENNQITLTPRGGQDAYVSWTIPEAQKQRIRKEEGGNQLALRLYDVTGLDFDRHPAHSVQQFECEETTQDMHLTVPQLDRDYIAELGYVTYQGRWCKLARSAAAHIPDTDAELEATNFVGETGFETVESSTDNSPLETGEPGLSGFEDSFRTGGTPLIMPPTEVPTTTNYSADPLDPIQPSMTVPDQPATLVPEPASEATLGETAAETAAAGQRRVRRSQIVLVAQTGQDAYASWELLEHHKEIAKQHGGQTFILRICDVTGVNLEQQSPHSIQQFNCEETDRDRYITVPDKGDYVAEIGYLAKNGRWLRIARSATVTIPANA